MKYRKELRQQSGFTLIELIVAVTIMVLLSSFGIASFVNYSRSQSLRTGVQDVVTTLQLAKASASSQVKPETCSNGRLEAYQVIITPPNTYAIGPFCAGAFNTVAARTVTLPVNVEFVIDTPTTITFHTVNGDVSFDPTPDETYAEILMEETLSDLTKTIQVYPDGRIVVVE